MKPDPIKADELEQRAALAAETGLRATAALLYRRAAWHTPATSPLRKQRFDQSKALSNRKENVR